MCNVAFSITGECTSRAWFPRTRTIADSGGGTVNVCVLYGTSSSVVVSATSYGYYNDSRGYQEIEVNLIAVPIA